jgi:Helicase associated domain
MRGDLDPNWVTKLNSLDFQWEVEDVDWNAMFDRLVAYKKRHGTVIVPGRCTEDPPLGSWVSNLRQRYGKLFKGCEKIDNYKISEVAKAQASTKLPAKQWLEMYDLLLTYKREHGSVNVPVSFPKLGKWVCNQRNALGISKRRKDLLDEVGFEWDPLEANWQEMFERLQKYQSQFGNTNVPKGHKKDPELASWVRMQRVRYQQQSISKEPLEKLELIGFVWSFID